MASARLEYRYVGEVAKLNDSTPSQPRTKQTPPPTTSFTSNQQLIIGGVLLVSAALLLVVEYGLFANSDGLTDLGKIAGYTFGAVAVFLSCVALLVVGFAFAIASDRDRDTSRTEWRVIGAVSLALFASFTLVYPATAIDIFLYAVRSRIWTEYGENPSRVIPYYILEGDPYKRFTTDQWASALSPYGPLWNWIAAPGTMFSDHPILPSLLYFKGIAIASAAGVAVAIYRMTRAFNPSFAVPAMLLWLWNPLLLWEGIANGHNDVVAILPLALALWAWQSKKDEFVIPLLLASVLIKYTALPLLPIAVVAVLGRSLEFGKFRQVFAYSSVFSAGLTVFSFGPFYDLHALWTAFDKQRGVYTTSVPGVVLRASRINDWGLNKQIVGNISLAIVTIAVLVSCWMVLRNHERFVAASYATMTVLLMLGTSNLRPWYVLWMLPLAIATGPRGPWLPAVVWSMTALLSYGHYIWVRDWWAGSTFWFEFTGVAITLIPVLATFSAEWQRRPVRSLRGAGYTSPR